MMHQEALRLAFEEFALTNGVKIETEEVRELTIDAIMHENAPSWAASLSTR